MRMVARASHLECFLEDRHASGPAEVARRSTCGSMPRAYGYFTQNAVPGHLSQNSKLNVYNIKKSTPGVIGVSPITPPGTYSRFLSLVGFGAGSGGQSINQINPLRGITPVMYIPFLLFGPRVRTTLVPYLLANTSSVLQGRKTQPGRVNELHLRDDVSDLHDVHFLLSAVAWLSCTLCDVKIGVIVNSSFLKRLRMKHTITLLRVYETFQLTL